MNISLEFGFGVYLSHYYDVLIMNFKYGPV